MNESIKGILIGIGLVLIGMCTIIYMDMNFEQKAVLIQEEKPPASIDVFILDNEIWIRPLDINGQSTKFAGNAQIQLSRVTRTDGVSSSYTHMVTNVVHINHFDLVYYNNRGNAANIYAATSELNLPSEKGLYRIAVEYYPSGETYTLEKDIIRGV